ELSVNYRTPAEIMEAASAVLAAAAPGAVPPRSMREGGVAPWVLQTGAGELGATLASAVAHELATIGDGRLGVIAPATGVSRLAVVHTGELPGSLHGLRRVGSVAELDLLMAASC